MQNEINIGVQDQAIETWNAKFEQLYWRIKIIQLKLKIKLHNYKIWWLKLHLHLRFCITDRQLG
jgi:hypothetical protein